MNIILILSIVILLISFFYTKNKLKEIKEQQSKTGLEIWEQEKEKYKVEKEAYEREKAEREREKVNKQLEYDAFFAKQQEICRSYELEKNKLENEIQTKTNFNNSLLQIREEELNRLIEEKKKEKEKTLEEQLKIKQAERTEILDAEFMEFFTRQEEAKSNILAELKQIQNELEDFRLQREAINQAIALENSKEEEKIKHQICLSLQDKEDIKYLLSIEEKINNKQLLRKLIWSEYLQKPFNEMLKRLFLGNPPKNVIYCIENIHNHKKYIGKTSAEVSKRWTEHIKTSLEIGTIKSQNIHKALYGHWDEFTFSIIVVSEKEKISADEKYYIKLFESDIYGYNMKGGG